MDTPEAAKPKFERTSTTTGTVESFISDGFAEIQAVGEELREAYDNAPDNLKSTSVNETRDSTAGEIEGLNEPSVDSSILGELPCATVLDNGKVYRGRQSQSRACRASNASAMIRAAAEALRAWHEEHNEFDLSEADQDDPHSLRERADTLDKIAEKGYDVDEFRSALEEAEQVASELEDAADTIDNLEFPGMFG